MFVLVEAGRMLYGDILVDLITSVVYPEADLRLKVGLSRDTHNFVGWLNLASGMSVVTFLFIIIVLALILSALYIPLPYEICDRHKVQFFELSLRFSNEYLGNIVEILFGPVARNHVTRAVAGLPYVFRKRPPKWCAIETRRIVGTRCRIYMPNETMKKSDALIIYIHGGGWCIMRPQYYDGPMLSLISRAGCPIVSIDYELSPEKIYPSAIEECERVIEEIYNRMYAELGVDREKISVMGDSAGGNLTAVLCQRFLRAKMNYIKCQILLYPVLHMHDFLSPAHQYYYKTYKGSALLNPTSLARWFLMYLGIEPTRKNVKLVLKNRHLTKEMLESKDIRDMLDYNQHLPETMVCKSKYSRPIQMEPDEMLSMQFAKYLTNTDVCPLLSTEMTGLPPAFIMTAGVDIVRDEGILYAKRLKQFNVPTKWNHYESAFHGILNMPRSKQRSQILDDIHAHLVELKLV